MRTIIVNPKESIDLRVVINPYGRRVHYYLRVFPDGTIDVHGRDYPGRVIALGAVGMDGITAGTALGARLARFLEDHKGECL